MMILTSLQNYSSATICTFVTQRDPDRQKSSVLLQTLWKCKTREVSRLTTTKTDVSYLFSEATEGWSSTRMQRKMQQQQLHCLSGKQQVLRDQLWKPLSEYKHKSEIQSGNTPHFFVWNSSSSTPTPTPRVLKENSFAEQKFPTIQKETTHFILEKKKKKSCQRRRDRKICQHAQSPFHNYNGKVSLLGLNEEVQALSDMNCLTTPQLWSIQSLTKFHIQIPAYFTPMFSLTCGECILTPFRILSK